MKKPLPTPAIVGIAACAILALGGIFWKVSAGSGEISYEVKKSPNYTNEMPAYIKEGRAPREGEMPTGAGQAPAAKPAGN